MKFWVKNMVRKVQTRMSRVQSPSRHRFKQYICNGRRLIRGRPMEITEAELEEYWSQLEDLYSKGILEIRKHSPDGELFTFSNEKLLNTSPESQEIEAEEKLEEKEREEEYDEGLLKIFPEPQKEVEVETEELDDEDERECQDQIEETEAESGDEMYIRLSKLTKDKIIEEAVGMHGVSEDDCKGLSKRRLVKMLVGGLQ